MTGTVSATILYKFTPEGGLHSTYRIASSPSAVTIPHLHQHHDIIVTILFDQPYLDIISLPTTYIIQQSIAYIRHTFCRFILTATTEVSCLPSRDNTNRFER